MPEALSIKRRKSTDNDTSFDSLRSEAIKLAHQLSGNVWTDYNPHDPGVTIFEQLIYAITDLIYRTEFPVEDYLVSEDGTIDYDSLGLHPPEEAFPCRPTTIHDYRKVFIDGVKEIDNVWLTPVNETEYRGLYRISVKLEHGLDEGARTAVVNKIRSIYNSSRNLCEDIADINIIGNLEYELCANIEVSSSRRPVDILAEIYFECYRCIAGSVSLTHVDQLLVNQVDSFDKLFSGPFTKHGFITGSNFKDNQREFLISSLYSNINSVDGVDHIQNLYLEKDHKHYFDTIISDDPDQAFCLLIPQIAEQIKVVLSKNGRVLPVNIHEVRARFNEINFKYHVSRSTPLDISLLYDLPKGVSRQINHYSSIQNQFPSIYGVNALGVPKSASTEVKAKARQLKSYLVIFEQLLTDYLANLGSIKTLFSKQREQRNSYSFNLLDKQQIPDLEKVYPENPAEVFKRIIKKYDNYNSRKSRLLDYLLALYGESFTQNSLRHFNYYYNKDVVDEIIVNNKIDYLMSVVELGRDRAAASDYSALPGNGRNYSGLQMRVSMLLGFDRYATHSMNMAILRHGIKITTHSIYEHLKAGSSELSLIDMDEMEESGRESFEKVPLSECGNTVSVEVLREMIGDAIPLKNNLLSDMLLRDGIYIDRYKVGSFTSEQNYQLVFQTENNQYWYIGTYDDRQSANKAANALRQFLILLNKESEGLHVVEHIMLRPQDQENDTTSVSVEEGDFFSFKVSIIFPLWTARCHNKQFRMLAEETVRINISAHICPQFYWLEFSKMYEFEIMYVKWTKLKRNPESDPQELNECAQALITFLQENRNNRKM